MPGHAADFRFSTEIPCHEIRASSGKGCFLFVGVCLSFKTISDTNSRNYHRAGDLRAQDHGLGLTMAPPLLDAVAGGAARRVDQRFTTEYTSVPENINSTSDAPRSSVDVRAAHARCEVRSPPRDDQPTPIGASTTRKTRSAHAK